MNSTTVRSVNAAPRAVPVSPDFAPRTWRQSAPVEHRRPRSAPSVPLHGSPDRSDREHCSPANRKPPRLPERELLSHADQKASDFVSAMDGPKRGGHRRREKRPGLGHVLHVAPLAAQVRFPDDVLCIDGLEGLVSMSALGSPPAAHGRSHVVGEFFFEGLPPRVRRTDETAASHVTGQPDLLGRRRACGLSGRTSGRSRSRIIERPGAAPRFSQSRLGLAGTLVSSND